MDDQAYGLLKSFFPQVRFTAEQESRFRGVWTEKCFDRYALITEAGNTERYFYFVLEGVQALYILNDRGEKVVLGFSYAGSPSGVFDSFVSRQASSTFLEALKPSRMLAINLGDYLALFELFPDFHAWGHLFFRNVLFGRLSREVELLTLSAEERYVAFMQRCPKELKAIPQKYLASYLNMKPETFSRLRSSATY